MKPASISVSKMVGDRLYAYAKAKGIPVRQIVEHLLEPVLAGVEPTAPVEVAGIAVAPQPVVTTEPAASRSQYIQAVLDAMSSGRPDAGLSSTVRFPVSDVLASVLDDLVWRERSMGRETTADELLDAAIARMLDAIETQPKTSFCGLCTETITGSARRLPLGRGDALVWVCYRCDDEHPRKGGYAFNGGRSADARTEVSIPTSGKDGNGNRRVGSKQP